MDKPIWLRRWTRVVAIIGGIGVALTGVATITGQLETAIASIRKVFLLVTPTQSGIAVEYARVGPKIRMDNVTINGSVRQFAVIEAEISILNRGDRDGNNCKARMTDDKGNASMDAPLKPNVPGHGVESQFAVQFAFIDAQYEEIQNLKIYCDTLISKPYSLKVPKYPLSSD
jgi:hypothetical protein